jgi:hypothetical protein
VRKEICAGHPCLRRAFPRSVVGLSGLAPFQGPQSARREGDGEKRGHAEREERPDEEESSAGLGDLATDALARHVDDEDAPSKKRPEKGDDVPCAPFGEHQRPHSQTTRISTVEGRGATGGRVCVRARISSASGTVEVSQMPKEGDWKMPRKCEVIWERPPIRDGCSGESARQEADCGGEDGPE